MENEPCIVVEFEDGEFQALRENTTLFTFLGERAMYDHIFFLTSVDDEKQTGRYAFRSFTDQFDDFEEYLVAHDYPQHLNLLEVAECDINAFDQACDRITARLMADLERSDGQS